MCGIYGVINQAGSEVSSELREAMWASLQHRGPDATGEYSEPGFFMGMNRLSIVDPAAGNQPIANEDGSLLIVYNGELYNHVSIRKDLMKMGHRFKSQCDTEAVLHAFEEYGPDCLKRFNGMYAFAIWNRRDRTLFVARDRLGIKPIYVLHNSECTAFASEAKALLSIAPGGGRPDWTAISRYLSFGYVPSPDSPFEGIAKLRPGYYAWIKGGHYEEVCYWLPSYGGAESVGMEEASSEVLRRVEKSVDMELMSDVPVGVFLSGGLDSSAVALFSNKLARTSMKSFALRFEEKTHDESDDARLVAKKLGFDHHEKLFSSSDLRGALTEVANILDEPFADSTPLPLLMLSKFAREHVKVVLTGWGGDEIFAGYQTYAAHRLARYYRRLPSMLSNGLIPAMVRKLPVSDKYMSFEFKARRFVKGMDMAPEIQHFDWMGYFDEHSKRRLFRKKILQQITGDALEPVRNAMEHVKEKDLLDRIMHLDAKFFLEGNGLFQADRMTMAASVEGRVPLLNMHLLEYVNNLPSRVKMSGTKTKELFRMALRRHLPKHIITKPKKGFGPPTSAWLRGPLAATLRELFAPHHVNDAGVFEADEVARYISEHLEKKVDHGRLLWALMSFQLWYNKYILKDASLGFSSCN
jgi:asparagine synthase (glutamine-hydrolysing)